MNSIYIKKTDFTEPQSKLVSSLSHHWTEPDGEKTDFVRPKTKTKKGGFYYVFFCFLISLFFLGSWLLLNYWQP